MDNVTVSGQFGDKPLITFTSPTPPEDLVVEVLDEGDGPVVEVGDTIVCNYLGMVWSGNVVDNSYDRGAPLDFAIGVGMVIAGWDDGLVGQKVGSRVLLSIPSHLAYGPAGVPQAGIKGSDTLVFVTDIFEAI